MKLVEYHKWCKKCKHYEKKEITEPCQECMSHPARRSSHKPINFKEKEKGE